MLKYFNANAFHNLLNVLMLLFGALVHSGDSSLSAGRASLAGRCATPLTSAAKPVTPQMTATAKDPKTALQEWLQGRKMKLPSYLVAATLVVAHKQTFEVECEVVELGITERGIGGSRRAGEQAAAAAVLLALKAGVK